MAEQARASVLYRSWNIVFETVYARYLEILRADFGVAARREAAETQLLLEAAPPVFACAGRTDGSCPQHQERVMIFLVIPCGGAQA